VTCVAVLCPLSPSLLLPRSVELHRIRRGVAKDHHTVAVQDIREERPIRQCRTPFDHITETYFPGDARLENSIARYGLIREAHWNFFVCQRAIVHAIKMPLHALAFHVDEDCQIAALGDGALRKLSPVAREISCGTAMAI
jgi:hypothetical protein